MIPISKTTSIKILAGLLVASGIMTYGFNTHIAKAAVGVTGLTGKYSCVGNRNFAPMMANLQNSSTVGANFLTILDFDAHTESGIIFTNSNWNQSSVTSSTFTYTGTFTETAGPISGSYKITTSISFSNGSTGTSSTNILLANSGNTFFYSTDAASNISPETGVCQKQ